MEFTDYQLRLTQQLEQLKSEIISFLTASEKASLKLTAGKLQSLSNEQLIDQALKLQYSELNAQLKQLKRVDAALCQIDLGLYGLCSDCEEVIELDRLASDPSTQRCQRCSDKHRLSKRRESFAL
ncbi:MULTISPECIES: TraR/DksA family transcriptional regulator [unclassified Agarivorans]|uniref:TraR/DksA family transcriptional regulator n=1 Tax=unclassified Agarivorans TaxID=2636026 RepID=UPI0010D95CFD|nr:MULTISPECIES: TraR/DksA C4-type zinc finger protein [unclassified Agarivorans]MDO6684868.1 TraR/DksA C4-type zinc finger protein [Agarivorans sp. 3_MG-2023]MDO6714971.1 TraR/DksA C4-type zinc finger protein [Agarivorans sp. 2_MG-2023]MDO6764109.1 TraR/DksA C4-type zinc finger protein [Agarivorans sp. 1_MG-2023]GDY27513.1 RNA polymerase-binding protein DksA [Agarivorans sp. Toyoura001]